MAQLEKSFTQSRRFQRQSSQLISDRQNTMGTYNSKKQTTQNTTKPN